MVDKSWLFDSRSRSQYLHGREQLGLWMPGTKYTGEHATTDRICAT